MLELVVTALRRDMFERQMLSPGWMGGLVQRPDLAHSAPDLHGDTTRVNKTRQATLLNAAVSSSSSVSLSKRLGLPESADVRDGPPPRRLARRAIRMGFMLDIVSYGRRDSPAKESLQRRLATVVRLVLNDIDVEISDTELQGTGDGVLVILPEWLDVQCGLAVLLRSLDGRLAHDNRVFQDRMRVRMAADVGPVTVTELGFGGAMVTKMGRMLNSSRLRRSVTERPELDLAVTLSDSLHGFAVAEGVPGLPAEQFTRSQVRVKELSTVVWLWTR